MKEAPSIKNIRKQIKASRRYDDVKASGNPNEGELLHVLDGKSFKPPSDAELKERRDFYVRRRIIKRNEAITERYLTQMAGADENKDMAGRFAIERVLTFVSLFRRKGLSYRDVHVFLMCCGSKGLTITEMADSTGMPTNSIWRSTQKLVKRELLRKELQSPVEDGGLPGDHRRLHSVFPITERGKRLIKDLGMFNTRDHGSIIELMKTVTPVGSFTKTKEFLGAVKLCMDELKSKLTLDW